MVHDLSAGGAPLARLTALQTVTAALSGAGSLDEVLKVVLTEARNAVGGAAASVGLVEPGRAWLRTLTSGLPEPWAGAFDRVALDAPLPGPAVIRDGRPRYYLDQAALAAEFPDAILAGQGTPFQAGAVAPLQVGDARLGFLAVHFHERRLLDAPDRALLTALARQSAVAVDRARRADAAAAERDLARRMQVLAGALAVANTVEDVALLLAHEGAGVLGASSANVSTYDPDSRSFTMVGASDSTPAEITSRFGRWSLNAPLPSRDVFATGRPVLLGSLAERDQRYPALAGFPVDQQAWANLLLQAGGCRLGLVAFGWEAPREFAPAEVELMQLIAELCAGALDRARLADEQRRIAETLQRGLLPPRLPRLPGWKLAARYRPAGTAVRAGGDWYDAFPLPGGQLGLLIGDVAGHGVSAAALMGQTRALARAEARGGDDPGQVLTRLNTAVCQISDELPHQTLVTCCYLQLDARNAVLRVASAGHLPPLLAEPAETPAAPPVVDYLPLTPGPPLGVAVSGRYSTYRQVLPSGATVLLFTDGLVERRGTTLDESLQRLCEEFAHAPDRLDDVCEQVLTTMLGTRPAADDVAVITARAPRRPR